FNSSCPSCLSCLSCKLDALAACAYSPSDSGEPTSPCKGRRLRVLRWPAEDPLNLLQVMLAKGHLFKHSPVAATLPGCAVARKGTYDCDQRFDSAAEHGPLAQLRPSLCPG